MELSQCSHRKWSNKWKLFVVTIGSVNLGMIDVLNRIVVKRLVEAVPESNIATSKYSYAIFNYCILNWFLYAHLFFLFLSCGRLYCADHTRYEMKLNTSAKHDPEHGIWCRVCHTCYVSRDGYLDNEGAIRSRTALFLMRRMKTIDRVHLESNKLEKRLEKVEHY